MNLRLLLALAFIASLFVVSSLQAEPYWPQFRGPGARGVSDDANLPSEWGIKKNVVWAIEVPGVGWSSPIVWGDRLFLTAAVNSSEGEEPKKGLYRGGNRSEPSPNEHVWQVRCIDVKTGAPIWTRDAHRARPGTPLHIKNTYASETPVTDGKRVYAYFGNVGLFVYDLNGKELWKKKWKPVEIRAGWGTAASPVLHGDRLFIINDNEEQSYLVALNVETGDQVWRVERDEASNWSTPYVWQHNRRTEIVTTGSGGVRSYDLNGQKLWTLFGMSSITVPTPFSGHGLLYVSSGFVLDKHRPVYAIRPGASGSISLGEGETQNAYVAWTDAEAAPYNPSPILYGDYFYVLLDRGFFTCHDAKTGEQKYKVRIAKDIGGFGGFTASPWAYNGKIFCLNEDGETFVVQAGPEYKFLGMNTVEEMCMATPAVARSSLFLRTLTKLYRMGASKG